MSEKIYLLLFRLFPANFRSAWQDDSLELFRDRARNEQGFGPRLRLWFDLLTDLALSLPRAYLRDDPALVVAPETPRDTVPLFTMIDDKPIRSSAFFFGTICSIVALVGISVLAKHGGHFRILHASETAEAGGVTMDPWATGASSDGGNGSVLVMGKGEDSSHLAQPGAVRPVSRAVHLGNPAPTPFFDAAEKHRVLLGVAAVLKQRYPDQASAQNLGKSLMSAESVLGKTSDPDAFAAALTRQLQAESRDMHFQVAYIGNEPPGSAAPSVSNAAYRSTMRAANCLMEPPAILPHNIGYLKLDWFPDPDVCGDAVIAAMKSLNRADSLILDLRDNSGGSPEMVMFVAGWLFNRPAFFYNPRESSADRMWTHSPMAGSQLAYKQVWVLTSPRTYSAAEQFSYNLKMLHRATLVGETTAGATDVGVFHRIDGHFGIGLRESKVPNPYPTPDWAVNGVQPDIRVPSSQALETAESLATSQLARR